jgi:hypothetical protein
MKLEKRKTEMQKKTWNRSVVLLKTAQKVDKLSLGYYYN